MNPENAGDGSGVAWDLSSFFPAFDGPEMRAFKERLGRDVAALQEAAAQAGPLTRGSAERWEAVVLSLEDLEARLGHLGAYLECLSAADAANEAYLREQASLARLAAEMEKAEVDLLHAFKKARDPDFSALLEREKLRSAGHRLRRLRRRASHTMSRAQEKLAADLAVDGLHAWGRMYSTLSGKLEFEMSWPDGRSERLPISQWRALMSHPDRRVGRAAFEGGNCAWATVADACGFAINAIAGSRLTLNRYRRHDHYLQTALFQSQVERETLDAMYRAIHATLPLPRRIFQAKARAMDRAGIWWFEREAPLPPAGPPNGSSPGGGREAGGRLGGAADPVAWGEGVGQVDRAFRRAYPALADYFRLARERRWIESEKRPGKLPGAFCTGSLLTGEQRVYMTFAGADRDVSTLAHEVGHAWHGWLMRGLRPMAHGYPMTLAETASVFAEQLLAEGAAADPAVSDAQKLRILDGTLCDAALMLLDITVRYEFERAFHDERQAGEVAVSRLKELMTAAQRRIWADALLPGGEDPYFWASKLHFYITETTFYNFPYTFGFLLAMALLRLFRERGAAFLPQYEDFLRMTGSGSAEEVVKRALGEDIRREEFWAAGIRALEEPLARYETLLAGTAAR
jgi:oligoendopeptidase F